MNVLLPPGGARKMIHTLFACLGLVCTASAVDTITEPKGEITVDKDLIRLGAKSQLTWNINYPAPVTGIVDVIPPNVIVPKKPLKMRLRVLGASFQQTLTSYLDVNVRYSINSTASFTSWTSVFSGNQLLVDPTKILKEVSVKAGDRINIGGRGYRSGWLPSYTTASTTPNLIMLANGDAVPTSTPALRQGTIESFLKPYINSTTRLISIGDKDLIVLMELGQTDPSASGFDLQDLVVLVTFAE